MFSLFHGFWKYYFQKDEYFILILGLDNAGKTTYLEMTKTKFNKDYKAMNPSKITSTVGLNIGRVDIGNIRLNFWDLGGQEELQSLWDKYYAECHGVIYIVDSSDHERLDESRLAFDKTISNDALYSVPVLLLANKQDLRGCMPLGTVVNAMKERIKDRSYKTMAVSGLTGEGVDSGINWVVQSVQKNNLRRPPTQKDIS